MLDVLVGLELDVPHRSEQVDPAPEDADGVLVPADEGLLLVLEEEGEDEVDDGDEAEDEVDGALDEVEPPPRPVPLGLFARSWLEPEPLHWQPDEAPDDEEAEGEDEVCGFDGLEPLLEVDGLLAEDGLDGLEPELVPDSEELLGDDEAELGELGDDGDDEEVALSELGELGDDVDDEEAALSELGEADELMSELIDELLADCDAPDCELLSPDPSAQACPLIPTVTNAAVAVPITPAASRRARASMCSPPWGSPTRRPAVRGRVPGDKRTKRSNYWKPPFPGQSRHHKLGIASFMTAATGPRADAVIGIGASAGGFDPVCSVVSQFKPGLKAAVLVVVHLNAAAPSVLDRILGRRASLPVEFAYSGCPLQAGHIYVAPPDHHMVLTDEGLELDHGPTVNAVRPSVDVTFGSMAARFGPRSVGVILSGTRDDGAAGLLAIKRAGGHAIVQDPEEALFPAMPKNALYVITPDEVAGADTIAAIAAKAVDQLPPPAAAAAAEADDPEGDPDGDDPPAEVGHPPGRPSELACPECGGVLWEQPEPPHGFRCRVGHAYSPDSLVSRHSQKLEEVLWSAVVALEERADLFRRVSHRLHGKGGVQKMQRRYLESAETAARHAAALKSLIAGTENLPSPTD